MIGPALALVAIAVLDQLTKLWALAALSDSPPIQVLGTAVQFTLVFNEGGAMGTRFGSTTYYTIIAILILPFLGYYLWKYRTDRATVWPLACILGGAVGNLIDRIRLRKVVDFIDVDIPDIHLSFFQLDRFWTFNVADSAITCAIVFMLWHMIFYRKPQPPEVPPVS